MVKFKMMFDKDKETRWLNQMAAEGYAMTGFCCGFFSFDKCTPGEYTYQVDFRKGFFHVDNDYREFMSEAGVEIVCCWGFWVILRRKTAEGPFELYTDVESTIEHYMKIRTMFKAFTIVEVICLILEMCGAVEGSTFAGVVAVLAAVVILCFVKEISRINDILYELKSRIGQVEKNSGKKRPVSRFLPIGLLCNSAALILKNSIENPVFNYIYAVLSSIAVVFILIGIADTFRNGIRD